MPRLRGLQRTAGARAARARARLFRSAVSAVVSADPVASDDVDACDGIDNKQVEAPRITTGLQLRMRALSELRTEREHSGQEFVYLPVDAAEKMCQNGDLCIICGDALKLDFSGFAVSLHCSGCRKVAYEAKSDRVKGLDGTLSRFYGGKLKFVYDSLASGRGFAGMRTMMFNLGLPQISGRSYYAQANFLMDQASFMWLSHTENLKECFRQHFVAAGTSIPDDGILNVAVSYDGTWMTRGHNSHVAVGFIMSVDLGFVLDFEVISNFCQECHKKKNSLSEEDFATWNASHTGCSKNYDGKSGAMEVEAALRLWQRSEQRGFRYVSFIGDGDSAAYNAVCALNDGAGPYATSQVVKEECVNHVSKRIGTRLRQLKDTREIQLTKKGKTVMNRLGGRSGLTDEIINKIVQHYGQTLRSFDSTGSVEELQQRILAIYYHATSTDAEPSHQNCPIGEDSWCWVKKAEALGEVAAPHSSKNLYLSGLSKDLLSRVYQVFISLTCPSLLQRCMKKQTQNRNESLHSKLWRMCLKTKFAGLKRTTFAAQVTSLHHNLGSSDGHLLVALGLVPRASCDTRKKEELTPKKSTPKKSNKRRRTQEQPSASYVPGGF